MTSSKRSGIWHSNTGSRRRLPRILLAGLLLCMSLAAHGWSEPGHIVIADRAMQHLSSRERERLDEIAQYLIDKDPALKQLQRRSPSVSATALTAAWFDDQRDRTVKELFSRFGRRIPLQLQSYSGATTGDWHYSNLLYDDGAVDWQGCPAIDSGELNLVLPYLPDAFASASNPQDKAIVLAILIHLIADAHQPLHGITRATTRCEHDRGGNRFCVSKPTSGHGCTLNLHHLWDQGFGNFRGDNRGRADTARIDQYAKFQRQLQPTEWQKENLALAGAIYDTPEESAPDTDYRIWASGIVRQRTDLAAARMAQLLSQLAISEVVGSE